MLLTTRTLVRNSLRKTLAVTSAVHLQDNYKTSFNLLSSSVCLNNNVKDEAASVFFNKDVQSLLKSLTRVDLKKVYAKKKLNQKYLEKPVYKFMTDKELEKVLREAQEKANELLQMPPVVPPRKPIDRVIAHDPALKGLETSPIIFTDITFGMPDSQRLIVVREPDGTLRDADWDVRDRMNQLYFPLDGRNLRPPVMFQEEFLKDLFKRKEFVFVLDRAAVQYEPDDPTYQKITQMAYEAVNESGDFDLLRSTRHFGPFVLHLVGIKNVDNFLLELIETDHIDEANKLLELYGIVHKVHINVDDSNSVNAVKEFIGKFAVKKGQLELAMQAYCEMDRRRKELQQGIEIAHGNR